MNEQEQNRTIDYYIDKCPMFNNYLFKYHNLVINHGNKTICEIDDLYTYNGYLLIGENKIRNSHACHKKMDKQVKRFKRYKDLILGKLGFSNYPVHFFYAHFDNDQLHIDYQGFK